MPGQCGDLCSCGTEDVKIQKSESMCTFCSTLSRMEATEVSTETKHNLQK
jgi:hypothetical protein